MKPQKLVLPCGRTVYKVRWRERRGSRVSRPQRTFDTRKEAMRFLIEDLARERGLDRDAGRRTFDYYADLFLEVARSEVKERSLESYDAALRHARRHFGSWPVADLKASDCRAFKAKLGTADYPTLRRARSVEWVWQAFRAVLDLAVEDEALQANPAAVRGRRNRGSRNKEQPFQSAFLTRPQVELLCSALSDRPPYDLMIKLLTTAPLRSSELAGLDVADVRLWIGSSGWRGYVEVNKTRRKVRGGWVEGTPKSERSRRRVDLPNWLAEELHEYMATQHPRSSEPNAPLFPNRRRGGYTQGQRGSKVEGSEVPGALDWSEPVEPSAFYRNVSRSFVRRLC